MCRVFLFKEVEANQRQQPIKPPTPQQHQQQQRKLDNDLMMAGEAMSISDLFNLNSPRGLLGNSFNNQTDAVMGTKSTNNNFQVRIMLFS